VGGAVVEDDLVVLDDNIYLVDDLVKPYMPSVYTNFRDDVFDWMLDRYKNYFCINDGPRTKLYLTRNHIKPGSRGVLNENDFINKLKEAGFLVVRGDESLEDIYKLFSAAALIVGPHGSLFANTIFSSESCRIYEFCPNNRVDTSFFRKNKKSHHYEHLLQDADDKFNITIPSQFIDFIINENV
jgi:capsular polysaccharide biosynthesis protein